MMFQEVTPNAFYDVHVPFKKRQLCHWIKALEMMKNSQMAIHSSHTQQFQAYRC
jgi:hypothetical protein